MAEAVGVLGCVFREMEEFIGKPEMWAEGQRNLFQFIRVILPDGLQHLRLGNSIFVGLNSHRSVLRPIAPIFQLLLGESNYFSIYKTCFEENHRLLRKVDLERSNKKARC